LPSLTILIHRAILQIHQRFINDPPPLLPGSPVPAQPAPNGGLYATHNALGPLTAFTQKRAGTLKRSSERPVDARIGEGVAITWRDARNGCGPVERLRGERGACGPWVKRDGGVEIGSAWSDNMGVVKKGSWDVRSQVFLYLEVSSPLSDRLTTRLPIPGPRPPPVDPVLDLASRRAASFSLCWALCASICRCEELIGFWKIAGRRSLKVSYEREEGMNQMASSRCGRISWGGHSELATKLRG
jgi:hypothetical protein